MTRFSNCTIATRDYWHARIFATKRTIKNSKIPPELAGNKLSGYVKYLNFDKIRRMGGLCTYGHIWANYTHVRQKSRSIQIRTLRLGSLEPYQSWLFRNVYLPRACICTVGLSNCSVSQSVHHLNRKINVLMLNQTSS